MSTGELVLRPADRIRGRFDPGFPHALWISFCDRALNHWTASRYVRGGVTDDVGRDLCPDPHRSQTTDLLLCPPGTAACRAKHSIRWEILEG